MSWYTIRHTCGHEERVQIYGPYCHGERDRKAAWMASKPCAACELKSDEDRLGITTDLKGTGKQVAWARKIRIGLIESAIEQCSVVDGNLSSTDPRCVAIRPFWDELKDSAMAELMGKESAAWFIDRRDMTGHDFALRMLKAACAKAGISI